MKIAVTGYKGRIGSRLTALGAVPLDCDVTDELSVARELRYKKPDVVVHAASIASIAECEGEGYERAIQVNFRGTNIVCQEAKRVGAKVVYLSTEQVFDGKDGYYSESDEPNPINDYGRSKLGGEAVARLYDGKIVRLSRGISRESGKDIDNYINDLRAGKEIQVPDFLWRSYSHLDFLAKGVWEFANKFEAMPSLIHLGGDEPFPFFHLMRLMAEELCIDSKLVVRRSEQIKENPRPMNCGLNVDLARSAGIYIPKILETTGRLAAEYA